MGAGRRAIWLSPLRGTGKPSPSPVASDILPRWGRNRRRRGRRPRRPAGRTRAHVGGRFVNRPYGGTWVCAVGTSIARPSVGHGCRSAERSGDRSLRGNGGPRRRGALRFAPPLWSPVGRTSGQVGGRGTAEQCSALRFAMTGGGTGGRGAHRTPPSPAQAPATPPLSGEAKRTGLAMTRGETPVCSVGADALGGPLVGHTPMSAGG